MYPILHLANNERLQYGQLRCGFVFSTMSFQRVLKSFRDLVHYTLGLLELMTIV
ncbi:unnamed protein product [Penicillium nalgiovense]|nr:unnamed protein product [Penicillium nalgiovense]